MHDDSTAPFFVELCAGSGKLSAAMKKRGFKVFPVDHEFNQHQPHATTVCLDLQKPHDQGVLVNMLSTAPVAHVHMGLPCGTCSRAREKALPRHLSGLFAAPPPLRDGNNLFGFPHLSGTNLQKVQSANQLYRFAVTVLRLCFERGITISIENPERSWLWAILTQLVLQTKDQAFISWFGALERVSFHGCMHGGARKKHTRLLSSPELFSPLAIECDSNHEHEQWNIHRVGDGLQFDTALEAEYPSLLCRRMADLLADYVKLPLYPQLNPNQAARRGMGIFVKKAPPLVPEFSHIYQSYEVPSDAGCKCIVSHLEGAKSETEYDEKPEDGVPNKKAKKLHKVGVQWSPRDFLHQTMQVEHPMCPRKIIPQVLKKAIFDNLVMDNVEMSKQRLKSIFMVRKLAAELEGEETAWKNTLEGGVKEVLSKKRILLWEKLLQMSNYDDMGIVDMIKQGIPLTGEHSMPPSYPQDWKPATASVDELLDTSTWRRASLQPSTDEDSHDIEKKLHEASLEEVAAGHLKGPFSKEQVDEQFGEGKWLFTKRFALMQGTPENPKVRVIDDCRRSGLNSAYTTNFKLELLDLDVLSAAMVSVCEALQTGNIDLGEGWQSEIHPSVSNQKWMGRTLDLSKAYKQLPISVGSRPLCVMGYKYRSEWKYYTTLVLPFGATAAVYSFNRVSRSLHHLFCHFFSIICTCYYDDFPTLSPRNSSALASKCMSVFLNLLGWDHAQVGAKAIDFSEQFDALGISLDLSSLHIGSFTLFNKPTRIEKILKMLESVSQSGVLSRAQAAEIQGHLNFASGFFLSKSLKFLLGKFDAAAKVPIQNKAASVRRLCELTKAILTSIPPRCFRASAMGKPNLLFTDGAWEDGQASAGLVFLDSSKLQITVQEICVPARLLEAWKGSVGEQLICQIEMYAFMVARYNLREPLHNRAAIAWIDNEAARYAVSKGTATAPSLMAMARILQSWETQWPTLMWVERVASYSNPADGPSRHKVKETAVELGGLPVMEHMSLPDEVVDQLILLTNDPLAHLQ